MTRKILICLVVAFLVLGSAVTLQNAQAAAPKKFFDISIVNMIKADDIGYPVNYQFVFSVYQGGALFRQYLLRREQRVDTQLPAGWYSFKLSDRNGKVLDRTGYYRILPGANVRWQSNLGPPDLAPQIKLKFK